MYHKAANKIWQSLYEDDPQKILNPTISEKRHSLHNTPQFYCSYNLYNFITISSWSSHIPQFLKTHSNFWKKRHTPQNYLFCKQPGPIWYIGASGASFLIYTPPIGGHHPVLYFPSQIQRNIVQRCAKVCHNLRYHRLPLTGVNAQKL